MTLTESILSVLLVLSLLLMIIFMHLWTKAKRRLQKEIQHSQEDDNIKSSFLTLVAQALRVPLNITNGICNEIKDEKENALPEDIREKIATIHDNNNRIYTYLNEVVELTNFNGSVPTIRILTVNLAELIMSYRREALYIVSPGVVVGIRTKMSPHCKATLNTKLFRQVMMNVLDIAARRTREGSITITYGWENEGLRFKIEDTGGHLPEKITKLLFSDVLVEAPVIDMRYKSTIINLNICRSIVESMRGNITIASGEKGAIVNFWIPCYVKFD